MGLSLKLPRRAFRKYKKLGVETAMHNDDVDWTGQTDVSDVGDILTSREETS